MDFFRRASKTASDITPPIVIIEELKSDIADLKDELDSALQAKKFATETLKAQLDANARTEAELATLRAELLEILARQQAEVAVMAAPSPGGSNRVMLESGELLSVGELETLIKQLTERVGELESKNEGLLAESDSLKKINKQNLVKLRDVLNQKQSHGDLSSQIHRLETELGERNVRISELEHAIALSASEIERIEIAQAEMSNKTAENEVLRMRIGELETEIVQLRGDLDDREVLQRELEQRSVLIESLRVDLETTNKENEKIRQSNGEYEDQVLELIGQVAMLKNDNTALKTNCDISTRQLIQARKDADEAVRRLELVSPKIDEAHTALVKAVQTALESRKETLMWKSKYEADIRNATERLKNVTASDLLN